MTKGKVVEGGSTITQQVVRNLYHLARADVAAEGQGGLPGGQAQQRNWSKDRILATWMNQVYFGNHAYGVEAASQTYFSKHAEGPDADAGGTARGPAAGAVAVRPDSLPRRRRSSAGRTC